jgi:NDP-sugar pyrophosphorylase family protein
MRLRGWENVMTGDQKIPAADKNLTLVRRDTLSPLAFSGIQLLKSDIFEKINRHGKFSLVDVYLDLCGREHILGWNHTGDLFLDVGKPESLAMAEKMFNDEEN